MTRDNIVLMARDAGSIDSEDVIETVYTAFAAFERQRLHDKFMEMHKAQQHSHNYWHFAARKIMEES